ncbi:MAG: hypothetical protein ABIU84_08880, partial [Thermoanaerobaculia bacterium]
RTRRIITCGDRSADLLEAGEKSWQDRFADIGMGRRDWPSEKILSARASLVRAAFEAMRVGGKRPLDLLRELGFRTLVPVRVVEAPDFKGVWRNGSRWNPATQPVCGGTEKAGTESYAPKNRGKGSSGHRSKGAPTVTEFPTGIRYESPIYDSVTLELPPLALRTKDVEIGGPDGVRDLLAAAAPAAPGAPPPPAHPGSPPKPERKSWREKVGF